MSTMFPLAVWQPGTLQPSTPVNDNALRVEILQRGATSIISTPPGSPADGQVHILGASPTGAWSTFAQNDVVLWRSGTWYRFAPFLGWLKQVGSDVRRFDGSAWVVISGGGGGGGAVPVQQEGTTIVASPTAISFVGSGVTATNVAGVATVTIPGASARNWSGSHTAVALGATISTTGMSAPAIAGTASFAAVSTASVFASRVRRNQTATAGVNAIAGIRGSGGVFLFRSTGAGIGGFRVGMELGVGTGGATPSHRFIMGLSNTTGSPSDVDPSTRTNFIGLGYDSADTQVQIMHNDGTGTATKVALGAGFPKPTAADTFVYQLFLTNVPGSGDVIYTAVELSTGATATGTLTTDLPSVGLDLYTAMSAGGTSTAINQTFGWFDVEV